MEDRAMESLRARLDETQKFPSLFVFKFIVPKEQLDALIAVFGGRPVSTRPSRHGNYIGVTAELEMASSGDVVVIYKAASRIPGIISF